MQVPYSVDDGNGGSDTATLTISVTNNPPLADADTNLTEVDTAVGGNVLVNDSDPNPNDDLAIVDPATSVAATGAVTMATTGGGSVTIQPDGSYIYTPDAGFTGNDTFDYTIIDEEGATDTTTVTIEVVDLNPPGGGNLDPIALNDTFSGFRDQAIASNVMSNDVDPDGDTLTVADGAVAATGPVVIATAQGGSVTVQPNGDFVYTPPAGFIGTDTFDYDAIDPSGAGDTATVTLTVTADGDPGVNDAPNAQSDRVFTPIDTAANFNVLSNDTDPNAGDTLSVTEVDGIAPTGGVITVTRAEGTVTIDTATGAATFTPAAGFTGNFTLPYTITDNNGATSTALISLGVPDAAPVAKDDINVTSLDQPVSGDVSLNDSDSTPGDSLTLVDPATGLVASNAFTVVTASGGTVVMEPSGVYTYTPAAGFAGLDSFSYTIADSSGKTADANVSVEVRDHDDQY